MIAYTEKEYGLEGKMLSKRYSAIQVIEDLTGYRGLSGLKETADRNIFFSDREQRRIQNEACFMTLNNITDGQNTIP